jgi:O-antigen/teichoic acid export membrane protein
LKVLKSVWVLTGKWKGRLLFALADQGCLSVANFLLTVFVANSLPLTSLGNYSIVWTISVLAETVATSLINDPLPAIVSRQSASHREELEHAAFWINLGLGLLISLAIFAGGLVALRWSYELGTLTLCLGVVNPLQRLQFFVRRVCYLRDRQDISAISGVIFAAVLLSGAAGLAYIQHLNAWTTVLLWGLASVAVVLTVLTAGVLSIIPPNVAVILPLVQSLWKSGCWLLAFSLITWISGWGIIPLAAMLDGSSRAGVLRAFFNMFDPVTRINTAITLAILPRLANIAAGSDLRSVRKASLRAMVLFSSLALSYTALFLASPVDIVSLFYHSPEIIAARSLLLPIALVVVIESFGQGTGVALLATARTQSIFLFRILGFAVFSAGALVLTPTVGIVGLVWAMAMGSCLNAILSWIAVFRRRG